MKYVYTFAVTSSFVPFLRSCRFLPESYKSRARARPRLSLFFAQWKLGWVRKSKIYIWDLSLPKTVFEKERTEQVIVCDRSSPYCGWSTGCAGFLGNFSVCCLPTQIARSLLYLYKIAPITKDESTDCLQCLGFTRYKRKRKLGYGSLRYCKWPFIIDMSQGSSLLGNKSWTTFHRDTRMIQT